MDYSTYYKEKLAEGELYQEFIYELFLTDLRIELTFYTTKYSQYNFGETEQGFEVKFDNRLKETGNLYIEVAEKSHPTNKEYMPSGIYRDDNTWLVVIGDYSDVFIFGKKQLGKLATSKRFKCVTTPTSKGYLIPKKEAEILCLKKFSLEKKL